MTSVLGSQVFKFCKVLSVITPDLDDEILNFKLEPDALLGSELRLLVWRKRCFACGRDTDHFYLFLCFEDFIFNSTIVNLQCL